MYHGALERLTSELRLVDGRFCLLTDARVGELFADEVQSVLTGAALGSLPRLQLAGECSRSACRTLADACVQQGVHHVIGLGGGKVCDASKIVADMLGGRCILIPTSPATCASAAWLAVEYEDSGAFVGNYWSTLPPLTTIVDLDFVYCRCPRRYLAAGIVDAMAKQPEIAYNRHHGHLWRENQFSSASAALAQHSYDTLMALGEGVHEFYGKGQADQAAEDVIAACISLTGLISALACGGRQAAASHTIYSYVCNNAPEIRRSFLHGEIVGASLLYQLALNGEDPAAFEVLHGQLASLGTPLSLRSIGLDLDPAGRDDMFSFIARQLALDQTEAAALRTREDLLFA